MELMGAKFDLDLSAGCGTDGPREIKVTMVLLDLTVQMVLMV
jgi:hypothetical protein